jgi:hypothetical protein
MSKSKRKKAQAKSWYPEPAQVRARIAELNRFFESCFPDRELPNNRLGRKWAQYMMRTKRLYLSPRDHLWLENWCPWMIQSERDRILGLKGHWYTGDSLGENLEVENDIRKQLGLWSIRPTDVEWTIVQKERRERQKVKLQEKRRANGVKPRRKGASEPWKALGMSKATYYRKKLHLTAGETPESPPLWDETPESPATPPIRSGDSQVSQAAAAELAPGAPDDHDVLIDFACATFYDALPERSNRIAQGADANGNPLNLTNASIHLDLGIKPGSIRDRAYRAVLASRPQIERLAA